MSDQSPINEYIEPAEFTEKDQADLNALLADDVEAEYHTLLEVWRELLKARNLDSARRVTIPWANTVCASYIGVGFNDMPAFADRYFDLVEEMVAILDHEISLDDKALTFDNPEEDRTENALHYKNLLMLWQCAFVTAEVQWDCTADAAATDIAALGEAQKLFFGPTGLVGHLEAIQFQFTEDDQADLAEALEETRTSVLAGLDQ